MSELRNTARRNRLPTASLAVGAPSSPDLPAQAGKSPAPASAGAGQTPGPGPACRVCRTRGTAPASRGKAPKTRSGEPSRKRKLAAASDDARGTSGAATAHTPAAPPARDACAAAAQLREDGATPRVSGDALHCESFGKAQGDTEFELFDETQTLQDGATFVRAVSARESLVEVAVSLLRSEDERIKQRTWERLVTIGPGQGTAAEEAGQMIWDIPRPVRD